jgi:hypothetical protein
MNSCVNNTQNKSKISKKIRAEKVLATTIQRVNLKMFITAFCHNLHHLRALNIKGGFEKRRNEESTKVNSQKKMKDSLKGKRRGKSKFSAIISSLKNLIFIYEQEELEVKL